MRLSLLLFCGLILSSTRCHADSPSPSRPNLLLLFADDLTWRAVRETSGTDIDTPNLDRLARRGTCFTHAYNPGGWHGAICVASRTMLMTGKQLWNARNAEPRLTPDFAAKRRLWPQRLADQGYRTGFTGKWHVETPYKPLFAWTGHIRAGGMPPTVESSYNRPPAQGSDPWNPADPSLGGYWSGGRHWSEVTADDAIAFIESSDPRPWFLYAAFNAPHDPRQAPESFQQLYPASRVPVPANFLPVYPQHREIGAGPDLRDEKLAPFPRTPEAVRTHRREYYAIISHLDSQIGRVLDALDRLPSGKNTIVCFTADHGLSCGEHGLLGKQNLYDSSVRVPFLIAGPGIPAARKIDAPVYLQDIHPTFLHLAGSPHAAESDFRNLQPLWTGQGTPRPAVIGAYRDLQRMIHAGPEKLILYPAARTAKLFDLSKDPHEIHNLLDQPENLPRARALFARLLEEQKNAHDPLDLIPSFPQLAP